MILWRHRDFLRFWMGQTVSEIGSRITREGLPMGAVLLMGVSPLSMSGLSLATQLPAAFLGVWIGVMVDRARRRPLMIFADLLRGVLLLAIPAAAIFHILHLWMFYVVCALCGICTLVFDVAYQAYLPFLVERAFLEDANQKLGVTASAAEVLGPGLTGVLVQTLTAPIAILFDAISYGCSAIALSSIRAVEPARWERGDARTSLQETDWPSDLRTGWRVIRQSPVLRALSGATWTYSLMSTTMFVLDTLYALRTLHLSAWMFGLTVTMGGVGSLVGAAVSKPVIRRFGAGKTMLATLFIQGLAASCWVFASGSAWQAALWLVAAQIFGDSSGMIYGIIESTIRQSAVDSERLGRLNGTIRTGEIAMTAIGSILAGITAEWIGIRSTMAISTLGMILSCAWLLWSPIPSLQKLSDVEPTS